MDPHIGRVVLPVARRVAGGGITPLGTCFAVGPKRFVTAAHVTGPTDEGLSAIFGGADALSDYQDTTEREVRAIPLKIIDYNPIYDISVLEFIDETPRVGFDYTLGGTDDLMTGSAVLGLGYPHADHGRLVLTQQASMVGARVLLGSKEQKIKHVVLNTQTRPGQCGAIFTADGRRICAMITGGYAPGAASVIVAGIDPQTLHQTTHAISAEYISELLV